MDVEPFNIENFKIKKTEKSYERTNAELRKMFVVDCVKLISSNQIQRMRYLDNKNAIGETFIKMDDQLAPRLGFSWDLHNDGSSKLFGTAGRYHLALPTP